MNVAQTRLKWLTGGMILALAGVSLAANAAETSMTVTATVLKHASMQVLEQPETVIVTSDDLARGFVDVPGTARFVVKSNTRDGYLVEFASQGDFFRQAMVRGLIANDVQLGEGGGAIAQGSAGPGMSRSALELGFRFVLSGSAQQGVYPWPVRLSVAPL